MDFQALAELTQMHQYDEMKIIGKDVWAQGKRMHLVAMMQKGEEAELCMLVQAEPEPEYVRERRGKASGQPNRQLMKQDGMLHMRAGIKSLKIGEAELEMAGATEGVLNVHELGSLLLMAKLADAGWQLAQEHPFFKQDWEQIHMMHYHLHNPSGKLPAWEGKKLVANWETNVRKHLVEKPVVLTVQEGRGSAKQGGFTEPEGSGSAKQGGFTEPEGSKSAKQGGFTEPEGSTEQPAFCIPEGSESTKQIAFTIQDENGGTREGICYINRVSRMNPLEETKKQLADAQYQKRMLEHMQPQEFETLKQEVCQAMEQACPHGKYFLVVEYECTLDLQLSFFTRDYLEASPFVHHAGEDGNGASAAAIMYTSKAGREIGAHGLKLREDVVQCPLPGDVQKVQAELFAAYETVPGWEEELKLVQ